MSQYTHFFIKTPENVFLPIFTFSSSSPVVEIARHAPWNKIAPVTRDMIHEWKSAAESNINFYEKQFETVKDYLSFIERANNPLAEKLDRLRECENEIEAAAHDKENAARILSFFQTLEDICDEADDTKYWDYDEDAPSYRLDPDHYVYYGCECSPYPTTDDII